MFKHKIFMATLILVTTCGAYAGKSDPYVSAFRVEEGGKIQIMDTEVVKSEKTFTYDWVGATLTESDKSQIQTIEAILQRNQNYSLLTPEDLEARGKLLAKVGSYYVHVEKNPDLGIAKIALANKFLRKPHDKMHTYIDLAFANERKYNSIAEKAYQQKANYYIDKALSSTLPKEELIVAYCIKGKILEDGAKHQDANVYFKKAYAMYEKEKSQQSNFYERVKNVLDRDRLTFAEDKQQNPKGFTTIVAYFLQGHNVNEAGNFCNMRLL